MTPAQVWGGHVVLGLGHARRRHPELALRHLSRAIERSPSFALAHAALGYALACGGQPQRGLTALEEALRLSPQDPFLDWSEWRNRGGRKGTRPHSLPAEIPKPWWAALKRLRASSKAQPKLK